MKEPRSAEVIVAFGDLAADLVVEVSTAGISISGLRIRRLNDTISVAPMPDARLGPDEPTIQADEPLSIRPGAWARVDVGTIHLATDRGPAHLKIPTVRGASEQMDRGVFGFGTYVNWAYPAGPVTVALARQLVAVGSQEDLVPVRHAPTEIPWARNGVRMVCSGEARLMLAILFPVDGTGDNLTVIVDPAARELRLAATEGSPGGTVGLVVLPLGTQRFLNRVPTASVKASDTLFVVGTGGSPRALGSFATAPGPSTLPLAIPPMANCNFELPLLALQVTEDDVIGVVPASELSRPRNAYYAGVPLLGQLRKMSASGLAAIRLLVEAPEDLDPLVTQLGGGIKWEGPRGILEGLQTDVSVWAGLWDLGALESEIIDDARRAVPEWIRAEWTHHMEHRLPAIRQSADLALGAVCLVTDMLRGRLPDDRGEERPLPWTEVADDALWLVPWTASDLLTRDRVIAGVVRRTVAEYTAIRAFGEMGPPRTAAAGSPSNVDPKALEPVLRQWLVSGPHDLEEAFASIAAKGTARDVIAAMAQIIFDTSPDDLAALRVALTNPLLILVAGGGPHAEDFKLQVDLPFWVALAGALSRTKPGAIAPTLLPAVDLAEALDIQRALRLEFYAEMTNERRARIADLRTRLGAFMAERIDPSVFEILSYCPPDRAVAVSDVTIDFVPFGGSILGLEVPLSRFPASPPALLTVSQVVRGATRDVQQRQRALLLAPRAPTDPQSEWAMRLANEVGRELSWLGLSAEIASEHHSKADLLARAGNAPVTMFFGHAQASEHWAAMDLGEELITRQDIASCRWDGCFVVLVGCETAAGDTRSGNLAWEFFSHGARAVVGTSAKVSVDVADHFFKHLFGGLLQGLPVDYAFHFARMKTAVYEALCIRVDASEAESMTAQAFDGTVDRGIAERLRRAGLEWTEVLRGATYALTFSLTGGINERIV